MSDLVNRVETILKSTEKKKVTPQKTKQPVKPVTVSSAQKADVNVLGQVAKLQERVSHLEALMIERDKVHKKCLENFQQNFLRYQVDQLESIARCLEERLSEAIADGLVEEAKELVLERDGVLRKIFALTPLLKDKVEGGLNLLQIDEDEENE